MGDLGSIPGLGRSPGEGNVKPTPVLLLGESHGQRSLVGYSLQGRKELDTTEGLHFHSHFLPLAPPGKLIVIITLHLEMKKQTVG